MPRVIDSTTAVIYLREAMQPESLFIRASATEGSLRAVASGRRGQHAVNRIIPTAGWRGMEQPRWDRQMSTQQLWECYWKTPDLRAAFDTIAFRVATWDWYIDVELDPSDDRYEAAQKEAANVARFYAAPAQHMTWQGWAMAVVMDLLVYEVGAAEKVRTRGDKKLGIEKTLAELVPLLGDSVYPVVDEHLNLIKYQQDLAATGQPAPGAEVVDFEPNDLLVVQLYPNTQNVLGRPLIESLVNQIAAILVSGEHEVLALDADELPPGFLLLGGLGRVALKEAKADFEQLRGKDHRLRVIGSPQARSLEAKWVEMGRKFKDVEFREIVKDIRRTIWRVCGVSPVDMGDTENTPRASAEVQVEVTSTTRVFPILEQLEAKLNAEVTPELVIDPELAPYIKFRFDREAKLTPQDRANQAQTHERYVRSGVMTRNEARAELGLSPVEGGDVPTIEHAGQVLPLVAVINGIPAVSPEVDEPGGVEDPDAAVADGDGDAAPGEVETESAPARLPMERWILDMVGNREQAVRYLASRPRRRSERSTGVETDDLPSDWQPISRFSGYRTLDLAQLGKEVVAYFRDVSPLYSAMAEEIGAAFTSSYGADGLKPGAASSLLGLITEALDRLTIDWALTTQGRYRGAEKTARDAVMKYSGYEIEDWEARADAYQQAAMGYLTEPNGLIGTLRQRLSDIVKADSQTTERALAATTSLLSGQQHRIDNWSGKLVAEANGSMQHGLAMAEGATVAEPEPQVWYAEWVSVGDENMCPICEWEGAQGFRPMSQMSVKPGEGTQCGSKCRCVLVLWLWAEVKDERAVRLSNYDAPAERPDFSKGW